MKANQQQCYMIVEFFASKLERLKIFQSVGGKNYDRGYHDRASESELIVQ